MSKFKLLALATAANLGMSGMGVAQVAADDSDVEARRQLDTIVITATKRETDLADTALSVSVVDGDAVSDLAPEQVTDLFKLIPGIATHESPGELPVIKIRGIGTSSANQTFEQSAGLFLDGVFKPRARQYKDALFDVERVEVIKGSQGVVFGKNTSVGAVSITTRKPGSEFGGEVSASYETEFESHTLSGGVDIPLGDKAALRLAGLTGETGGYVENTFLGETDGDTERTILRGVLDLNPNDRLNATLMAQVADKDTVGNSFQILEILNPAFAPLFNDTPFERSVDGDLDAGGGTIFEREGDSQESSDFALSVSYDISDSVTLSSQTSFSEFEFQNTFDTTTFAAPPGLPIGNQVFNEEFEQFTQEIRLDYTGDRMRLLTGLFYQDQSFEFRRNAAIKNLFLPSGTLFPAGPTLIDLAGFDIGGNYFTVLDQDLEALSGFAQLSYDVSDRFTVDVGMRVTEEEKQATYNQGTIDTLGLALITIPNDLFIPLGDPSRAGITVGPLVAAPPLTLDNEFSDTSVDGSLTLSYAVSDDWLVYGSLSQGTKSGSFNNSIDTTQADFNFIIDPEVARTAEFGVKGTFADGAGYLAASVFHSEIEDFQESFFDEDAGTGGAGAFITQNLDATSTGIEAEALFALTDAITLNGNFAILDATADATGETLVVAPESTGAFGATYDSKLTSNFSLQMGATASFSSSFLHRPPIANPQTVTEQDLESGSYTLLDLYLGVTHDPTGVALRLDGGNVTDERYSTFEFIQPSLNGAVIGTYNRPATLRFSVTAPF